MYKPEHKACQQVRHWILLLVGLGPEMVFIKGPKNVLVADVPCRPPNQGDILDNVEAVLSFASNDEEIFSISSLTNSELSK